MFMLRTLKLDAVPGAPNLEDFLLLDLIQHRIA